MFDNIRFMLLLEWNVMTDNCYCEKCVSSEEKEEAELLIIEIVEKQLTTVRVYQ